MQITKRATFYCRLQKGMPTKTIFLKQLHANFHCRVTKVLLSFGINRIVTSQWKSAYLNLMLSRHNARHIRLAAL